MILGYILMGLGVLVVAGTALYFVLKAKRDKEKYNSEFDFETTFGIRVKLSELTKEISKEIIDEWVGNLVLFWKNKKGFDPAASLFWISRVDMFIYDELYITRGGIKVNGVFDPDLFKVEIASLYKGERDPDVFTPMKKVQSLVLHEFSHLIAYFVGDIPFEKHHDLFVEVNLGA